MSKQSKHDIVCLERGDIDYIKHVAGQLAAQAELSRAELDNYAKALHGIVRAATELESLATSYL